MAAVDTVQSVTGPLAPADLGVTLPHEHVFINMTRTTPQDGYLNVWSEMESELHVFSSAGGATLIDMSNGELSDYAAPIGWSDDLRVMQQNPDTGSRSIANVLATKAMSEATGVQVILGTGHYYETYLDTRWFDRNSTNKIAEYLIARPARRDSGHGRACGDHRRDRVGPLAHHGDRGALVPGRGPRQPRDGDHGLHARRLVPDGARAARDHGRGGRRSFPRRHRPRRHGQERRLFAAAVAQGRVRRVRLPDDVPGRRKADHAADRAAHRVPRSSSSPPATRSSCCSRRTSVSARTCAPSAGPGTRSSSRSSPRSPSSAASIPRCCAPFTSTTRAARSSASRPPAKDPDAHPHRARPDRGRPARPDVDARAPALRSEDLGEDAEGASARGCGDGPGADGLPALELPLDPREHRAARSRCRRGRTRARRDGGRIGRARAHARRHGSPPRRAARDLAPVRGAHHGRRRVLRRGHHGRRRQDGIRRRADGYRSSRSSSTGIGDTGIRPALLGEIGTSWPITDAEWRVVRAAARAGVETGATVYTHQSFRGKGGTDGARGDPRRGHERRPRDHRPPRRVLGQVATTATSRRPARCSPTTRSARTSTTAVRPCGTPLTANGSRWSSGCCRRVSARQLVIAQDVWSQANLRRNGGNGYDHLFRRIGPAITDLAGGDESVIRTILIDNPDDSWSAHDRHHPHYTPTETAANVNVVGSARARRRGHPGRIRPGHARLRAASRSWAVAPSVRRVSSRSSRRPAKRECRWSSSRRCTRHPSSTSVASSTASRVRTASRATTARSSRSGCCRVPGGVPHPQAPLLRLLRHRTRDRAEGLQGRDLILIGGLTDVCIHYTAVDAHQHDYRVRVVQDAVGGSSERAHTASLEAIEYLQRDALVDAADVVALLRLADGGVGAVTGMPAAAEYVVIGGGTAGNVVAARLAEAGYDVLVLRRVRTSGPRATPPGRRTSSMRPGWGARTTGATTRATATPSPSASSARGRSAAAPTSTGALKHGATAATTTHGPNPGCAAGRPTTCSRFSQQAPSACECAGIAPTS